MSDNLDEQLRALELELDESESHVDRAITAATRTAVLAALLVLLGVGIGLASLV